MNNKIFIKDIKDAKRILKPLKLYNESIAIIGSARISPSSEYARKANKLGKLAALNGYAVITGGGPGIMEAANRGCKDEGGISVGLTMELPYTTQDLSHLTHSIDFNYFFSRKIILYSFSKILVAFPGGMGTLDELFECITLKQTDKIDKQPIYLVGSLYWNGMIQWLKQILLDTYETIKQEDLDLFVIIDKIEDIKFD